MKNLLSDVTGFALECDYRNGFVPVDASRCKFCTSELVPEIVD